MRGGGGGGAVNSRTVLKAANLVNGKEHMEGRKARRQAGRWAPCTSADTHVSRPAAPDRSHEHARVRLQKQTAYK